jgi:hypothetical protein
MKDISANFTFYREILEKSIGCAFPFSLRYPDGMAGDLWKRQIIIVPIGLEVNGRAGLTALPGPNFHL